MAPLALRRFAAAGIAVLAFGTSPLRAETSSPDLVPLHSFRMSLVDATPQGTSRREITYVAPDKLRVEIPGMSMVVVAIGRAVWLREPSGAWQRADYAPGADPLVDVRGTLDIGRELSGPDVRYLGTAQLAGLPTKVYDVAPPLRRGLRGRTTRIWIGSTDGYPHRIVVRRGRYVFTATYSQWNQPLSVSEP